ncbi:MAG TPA: hypothetical protein VNJ08_02205 [Bacteriovoracaceae bacterium]|nr:hypothetical protein [Bacteriovoracaceae bacterium]
MRVTDEKLLPVPKKNQHKQVNPVRTNEVVINWKRALNEVLCKSEDQTDSERNWARLCNRLRDLCPETNWIFIHDYQTVPQKEDLEALHVWLEGLIAVPTWPFPEQLILTSECNNNEHSWKLLFSRKVDKLPFSTPPLSLTIIPFHDQHSSGWHIRAIDSFTINQAGEA